MGYSSVNIFRNRKNTFSDFWFEVVKTRFVLCLIIIIFSLPTPDLPDRQIFVAMAIYILLNVSLGFWKPGILRKKKVRILPELLDIIFISFLTYFTGGQDSPWFLLYCFPIMSASRYLSYEGCFPLAILSIVAYGFLIGAHTQRVDYYSFILKCLVFLGIAWVAGNLTRVKQGKEHNLIKINADIDKAILDDIETVNVLKLLLDKALEFTGSDMGQIKILNGPVGLANTISSENKSQTSKWNVAALTERYHAKVMATKKAFSIVWIKRKKGNKELPNDTRARGKRLKHLKYVLVAYVEDSGEMPRSALFVPLILNEEVKAIISLYSNNKSHYSQSEAINLGTLAQLLGIALKNSALYQGIIDSEREKKERLKMLYEIGEQLKVEQDLADIFQKVVDLAYNRLNSEEAALFLWDEKEERARKEAVKGPSEAIAEQLAAIEQPYKWGDSLVGTILKEKRIIHLNPVDPKVDYAIVYANALPSKKVSHYLGVPLIIGEEVLGVIRVINKRAASYSLTDERYELSDKGFAEEDVELMQTIASQVVSAIRSAKFIQVQRYYKELVENSPDPIIVVDEKGKIKVFNKACEKIWGVNATEVEGQPVENYYESKEHAREIGKKLWNSPNNRDQDIPARIKTKEGEIIPISLSASRLFDKQGKEIGSIGVFRDLRETIRLQEEAMRVEKLVTLGKLAHTVGHEIKHHIATALNYIDVLKFECTEDEELSRIYHRVQESLSEAVDKFQNMLMVGRPRPPQKELIGVAEIFRRVEFSMHHRAESKKIEMLIDYPHTGRVLEADIEQLRQVLLNLFDNSVDAIEARLRKTSGSEKGRIELAACTDNGNLQIIWKDNGCGIPAQNISNIFTPFVTDKPTGNGLGLFIVKSIIENHGGVVSVESEEGKGTSFKIVLPLI